MSTQQTRIIASPPLGIEIDPAKGKRYQGESKRDKRNQNQDTQLQGLEVAAKRAAKSRVQVS